MKIKYNKNYILNNIDDTIDFAISFSKSIKKPVVIALIGDLGSGKTFFTKEVCKYFGVEDEVVSPTFNIIKTYDIKRNSKLKHINHFDVYRIKSEEELLDIGFDDYIYDQNSINIIEWADLIQNSLPENTIYIIFFKDIDDINKREVCIEC